MGLFDKQRQKQTAQQAEVAAAGEVNDEDRSNLIERAWANIDKPTFVDSLYERLAARDAEVKLGLTRLADWHSATTQAACVSESLPLLEPYVVSRLLTLQSYPAYRVIGVLRDRRLLPVLRRALASGRERGVRDMQMALARLGEPEDLPALRGSDDLAVQRELARRGDVLALERLVAALAAWEEGRDEPFLDNGTRNRVIEREAELRPVVRHAAALGLRQAAPLLRRALRSRLAAEAMSALGDLGLAEARDELRAFLARQSGDLIPYCYERLAAENALSALGDPQPLDTARYALASVWAIAIRQDGECIATGGKGRVRLYDGALSETFTLGLEDVVRLEFSPDGSYLYALAKDGTLVRFARGSGDYAEAIQYETSFEREAWALAAAAHCARRAV